MKQILLLLIPAAFILNSFGPAAQVNDFKYNVTMDGKPIGSYAVSQTKIGNATTLHVETETAAGLIGRINHKFTMMSSFDRNKFVSADLKTWVNGELEARSLIHWDGHQYVKRQGEKLTEICSEMVDYSSASMFFEEPDGRTELFYEKYGRSLPVMTVADHQYEVELPNGSIERYTYKGGEVSEVEIVQTFATITLKAN